LGTRPPLTSVSWGKIAKVTAGSRSSRRDLRDLAPTHRGQRGPRAQPVRL